MKVGYWVKRCLLICVLVLSSSLVAAAEDCQEQTYAMHITHNLIKSVLGNPEAQNYTIEQDGRIVFNPCTNKSRTDLKEIYVEGALLDTSLSLSKYPKKSFLRAELRMKIKDSAPPSHGEGVTIIDPLQDGVVVPSFCLYATQELDDYGYGVETCFSDFRRIL